MDPSHARAAVYGWIVVTAAMTVLWRVSLRLRDASIVDPFWGPGFVIATATYLLVDGHFGARGVLTLVLVSLWAARLGLYLVWRNRRQGGPMLMTFLLLRVSGVTMLEKGLRASRPAYDEYVRRTSAFINLPPRR